VTFTNETSSGWQTQNLATPYTIAANTNYTVSVHEAVGHSSFSNYVFCANENATCSFSGTLSVAYGANGAFNYLILTGGTACNNTVFGDPIYGVVKACYISTTDMYPWNQGNLHIPAGGDRFVYSSTASVFPTNMGCGLFKNANYFVDLVFNQNHGVTLGWTASVVDGTHGAPTNL
jgi:Domain of unknown function (DUF4082)